MKTKILIICAVVILLCSWFLLHHTVQRETNTSSPTGVVLTNQQLLNQLSSNRPEQSNAVEKVEAAAAPNADKIPPRPTKAEISDLQQQILADWQRPIEFYGKVVDENTNPVAGANVTFKWTETPSKEGNRTANTESDPEGLFSLRGQHGPSLGIWVSKEGYYASHRGQTGVSYLHGDFSPDPQNPVVFNLRKKGIGENLIGVKQNYRVARDGTPLGINLTTGKASTGGSGDFVVQCWTEDQGKPSGAKYDWRCLITVPGGGMQSTDEEFAFLAPENGYALTNEIAMPADRTNWTSQVDLKFFYRLADGRYGRMTFSMIAGGQHFCMIDSILNPSGSRNLEPNN